MSEPITGRVRSPRRRRCGLCGRLFHGTEGVAYQGAARVDLCHPADSTDSMTCYHRWTVYKERP